MAEVKPTVYVETTIPSYLAAWPSRDLIRAAHQRITTEWWSTARHRFSLYVSEFVLDEAAQGDPSAAEARLEAIKDLQVLVATPEVRSLADVYNRELSLPPRAIADAFHLACSVVYEMDFLTTWNCTHLANPVLFKRVLEVNARLGRWTPVITTPEMWLESGPEEEN